jgi:hypothetical protein
MLIVRVMGWKLELLLVFPAEADVPLFAAPLLGTTGGGFLPISVDHGLEKVKIFSILDILK